MDSYNMYIVEAKSFEGIVPLRHRFKIPGKDKDDVLIAILHRWPELYDIDIKKES